MAQPQKSSLLIVENIESASAKMLHIFRNRVVMAGTTAKESVWSYPRPPKLEQTPKRLKVLLGDQVVADSISAYRVLETSHPPAYYIPLSDVNTQLFSKSSGGSTFCEWKGTATYWDVTAAGQTVKRRVWSYEKPAPSFEPIQGYLSFYASPFTCFVDDEKVSPQPGDFYGGWITSEIEGPFKGSPGTLGW